MKLQNALIGSLLVFASHSAFSSTDAAMTATPENVAMSQAAPLSDDALFARLLIQESGGRQLSASGAPITSPKGAVGAAQVMPGTAPEAARLAGLEWSQWKYRHDEAYNKALGRAYLNAQLDKYSGNHVLALAAYNAGPGSVDNWLKRYGDPRSGQITNNDFIQLIPFLETQDYVSRILNGSAGAVGNAGTSVKPRTEAAPKFEFKDTHPGFRFGLAVNRTFNSQSRLVGGL